MHVSISNPVEGVVTGSSNIFFIDCFCIFPIACISRFDIFPHASNPYNISGMKHDLFLPYVYIWCCSIYLSYHSVSLVCFQSLLCALLDYFLCLALFRSNYMYLLLQSLLLLPLLFILVSLFQLLLSYILLFQFILYFLEFLFLLCLHPLLQQCHP